MSTAGEEKRNVRTKSYRELLNKLPLAVAELAEAAFDLFQTNPHHPALNNHALYDTRRGQHRDGSRAVSVTSRYRAIYVVEGNVNVWYWIGTHEAYNNFTGSQKK